MYGAVLLAGVKNNGILAALAADSCPKDMLGAIYVLLPYRMGMAGIAVHFQNFVISPPMIRGERKILHRDIMVICSSCVNSVLREGS